MKIYAYNGISKTELEAERTNSEGKTYTLDHPNDLLVSMRYNGEHRSNSNSQGWDRNSSYYFENLRHNHPEFFSKKNIIRINNGHSPKVDAQFLKYFPQYRGFENEVLVHHHIGKDGQAVAIPASVHKGSGEIHLIENELGVTANAQHFSARCKEICVKDPSNLGNTSEQFRVLDQRYLPDVNAFSRVASFRQSNPPPQKYAFSEMTHLSSEERLTNHPQSLNGITRISKNFTLGDSSLRENIENSAKSDGDSKSIDHDRNK